jgi:hypothetical protein
VLTAEKASARDKRSLKYSNAVQIDVLFDMLSFASAGADNELGRRLRRPNNCRTADRVPLCSARPVAIRLPLRFGLA